MTDADALLASILDRPDDDLPRLVFADWLDEQGNESDAARAAFIRVGCEIAELERERVRRFNDAIDWKECTGISATWCGNCGDCSCKNREESMSDKGCPLHDPASKHCCLEMLEYKESRLRNHERELWNANSGLWFGTRGPNPLPGDLGWAKDDDGLYIRTHGGRGRYVIRRGFVWKVECTVVEFLGGECERCRGSQWVVCGGDVDSETGNPIEERCPKCRCTRCDGTGSRTPLNGLGAPITMLRHRCKSCNGEGATGRTEGIAKRLFESQPIMSCVLSDRHPTAFQGRSGATLSRWAWNCDDRDRQLDSWIPFELAQCLEGFERDEESTWFYYSTAETAYAALNAAAVRLGRSLASLSPLEPVV